MPLPLLAMAVGAGIGAGVGQLTGGNTKSTLTGAGIGAAAGFGFGGGFGGTTAGTGSGAGFVGPPSAAANVGTSLGGQLAAGGKLLTKPIIPGLSFTSPLFLGAAGLSLAAGGSTTGAQPQDKPALSERAKQLKSQWVKAIQGDVSKAKAGDVDRKAAGSINRLKVAEGLRTRATTGNIQAEQATAGNVRPDQRGGAAIGGRTVKAELGELSERMEGLFAPTSVLNAFRKEDLINAAKQLGNITNVENQVASFSYSSRLSSFLTNNLLSAQKGAAIGGIISGAGRIQAGQAQQDAYNRIAS